MGETYSQRPVVAIIADRIDRLRHPTHAAGEAHVGAVALASGALPLILPVTPEWIDTQTLIDSIDGLVLTGSISNVAAERYGEPPLPATTLTDLARDAVSLALLPQLVDAGVPVLAICRGFQELNVAYGGTLEKAVHEQPGRLDHREGDHDRPIEAWYADSHAIDIVPGGHLAPIAGQGTVMANSLHHQGVEKLGAGLRVVLLQ